MRYWDPRLVLAVGLACTSVVACGRSSAGDPGVIRATLIHLEDELARARVTSAPAPAAARAQRAWSFGEPRPDWRVITGERFPGLADVTLEPQRDRTKLALHDPARPIEDLLVGGMAVELEGERTMAWEGVLVRARSRERLAGIAAACNIEDKDAIPGGFSFFGGVEGTSPVFNDGSEQAYLLPLPERGGETLRNLGIFIAAPQPAGLDILSVALIPRGAAYLEDFGVCSVTRGETTVRTLFAHAPARLCWRIVVPEGGRLDLSLTTVPGEVVAYRALVTSGGGEPKVLLDETPDDPAAWRQRSVDLSHWAGSEVELCLEGSSEREGSVALFGAPIVSGSTGSSGGRRLPRPNVILYVIDGGGADLMSLYGYNRRTTPFLERLAGEAVVFERAHSNSTWTQPSTASFMTSLQHSVLGGLRRGVHSTPVPAAATTMAEHMRRGGYQTAAFTTNPNAARVIGLERGVDVMSDADTENHSTSSSDLHARFWRFREEYPGAPYWVHFQTTDVHEPNHPPAPFAGLFVSPEDRARMEQWDGKLWEAAGDLFGTTSIADFYDAALEKAGIDRRAYYNTRRGLYDETMAYQDRELERFVLRLKEQGEWENTLLIVAADHGHPAGTFARFGRGLFEPRVASWQGALCDSYATRVPLLFVWPKKITGGSRITEPVSMIDVLPTILELVDLPQPDIVQGRSLAPLLLGRELEPRPVILDEFRVDEVSGELVGNLEMIDGRWGASLEIGPVPGGPEEPEEPDPSHGRHAVPAGGRWGAVHPFFPDVPRLLLYDLWNDPFTLRAVNEQHPDKVEHYRRALLEQWGVHLALARRFGEVGEQALTPEVLKQLQGLGYVR